MATLASLITVEQFRQLPEGGECTHELRHGEVVEVTRPKARHSKLQLRLLELLGPKLRGFGKVTMEFPYRPVSEFELRAADVAVVSRARWDAIDPEDNLYGAPELMIEVKSPSNTRVQLQELVSLCLANGAFECWIAEPVNGSITVARRDGSVTVYRAGEIIPLKAFGADGISVSEIFA